jgi:hypothetical protein
MISKTRRGVLAVAAAVAASALMPAAPAGARPSPCQITSASTGSERAIVVAGHYEDSQGGDVILTCHIYQGATRVASVTDEVVGPVAAIASDQRTGPSIVRVCYEVTIWRFVDWGYYHSTDC